MFDGSSASTGVDSSAARSRSHRGGLVRLAPRSISLVEKFHTVHLQSEPSLQKTTL
ncbi:hypothetical protein PGTUg99_010715 [Puccinia graminis f. sp. tritici]|uniref:Uncharacterized protein n=1 Tax=Puccinia graminis f. sp. tritici TaxID=56615 RepID=A0A5B0QZ03_PUCGR|nr:hypothetical protein PGTUg99_010715 [Puccinia graminis f. sp. tritici]